MIKCDGMDINEIYQVLPHRYPFLLLDRVKSIDITEKKLIAFKAVSVNEPQFQGHFGDNPIMPGVLLIEAMAQASIILGKALEPEKSKNGIFMFLSVDNVKFEHSVRPGCMLRIEAYSPKVRDPLYTSICTIFIDDLNIKVASGEIKAFRK